MFNPKEREAIRDARDKWEETTLQKSLARNPERAKKFITTSSEEIERLYTPEDIAKMDYARDLNDAGQSPFTRGPHATMYRSKVWTMRMFAGFGTAEETNARFKYLLAHGETGLSTAFDMPTLYGYDTDAPQAIGEFGKCGVAISSLADMEILFDGIPVDQVTTSMTINSPAAMIWAMYIAAAEKRGIPRAQLGGTIQNDILKEYIAQKEFIFPPEPSMRLVTDTIEFGTCELPKWNTVSISGYHIREAGSTAAQELAFTLSDGFEYVRWAVARGMNVDEFAPRLSFFFNAHNDFFEELAKYRAARRIWARAMKEKFGAKNPRAWLMRFHTQTAGVSLTAQQPMNNVARVALQALAGVLGGTQSLHTNSLDEAWALPSEQAAMIALRTQQIIAEETGVTNTVDPFGGSYFVEAMTNKIEQEAYAYFDKIEKFGGVLPAIERGFQQREIAEAAARYQREIDTKQRIIVGVNEYVTGEALKVPLLRVDEAGARHHLERLQRVRATRDNARVGETLNALRHAAQKQNENLMPYLIDAVNAYTTLQEMMDVLRREWGEYREEAIV
ncbi:MAG: methylmalonyl-CoA mutase family protein [Chloroflexi bacterium]|nr:methylmalonyl-CoA mutase family protein [Chloroflexota bacterium]